MSLVTQHLREDKQVSNSSTPQTGGGGNHWPGSPILGVKALCGVHLLCRPRMFTELPRWQISLQAQSSVSSTLPSKTATVPFVAVLPTTEHNL